MPRISAATNAAQRENTKRAILDSFGEILYTRGLPGLTMTDVAKNAGIGRTAVYNYFADMGELLVAYAGPGDAFHAFPRVLCEARQARARAADGVGAYSFCRHC